MLDKQILGRLQSKTAISESQENLHVSSYSFYRILNQMEVKVNLNFLPEVLCVDEFKATKDCKGNMAFVAMDGKTHQELVILDDRRLFTLVKFFMKYKRQVREQVKYLVMDMNASYGQLIKTCFPNAQIVTDRFHIVQQMTKAFNNERIQIMKRLKTDSKVYRHLKTYWKLLLKPYEELSTKVRYNLRFQRYISSQGIVDQLLTYDSELNEAWQIMQLAISHFRNRDKKLFFELLESLDTSICPKAYIKKYKFLLKHRASVGLAMEISYSNGCIEGMNNKIKALKRAAFGFRRFDHFVKRIFLMNMKRKNA